MIIGHGSPWIFFESNIAKGMWLIILILLLPPLYSYYKLVRGKVKEV
jgi:putative tricarboxylic transport membrane protein